MITICTNHEVNQEALADIMCDVGLNASQISAMLQTDESDIWQNVFASVVWSEYSSDFRISNRVSDWCDSGRFSTTGWRAGILHSDLSQKEVNDADAIIYKLIVDQINLVISATYR